MQGYDKLAALMTGDKGLSIFRRFTSLNVKNLLYLQAEIVNLEKELREIIQEDSDSNDGIREKFAFSVRDLKFDGGEPTEQWVVFLKLRALLKEYNDALIQHTQLLRFKPPHERDLEIFRGWLADNAFCQSTAELYQWFGERDENVKDLVAISGRYEKVDSLTRWVFSVAIPFFHRVVGHKTMATDVEIGTVYYDDEKIIRATRATSMIASSVIPASSMVVLYLVENMVARLIIIIVYNIAFSVLLGLLAKARRVEVFAASTAFAAVQVAFITNFPRD